jgi:hypothetical protein
MHAQIGTEPETISTKTDLLIDKSPVFRAMLEGPMSDNTNQVVRIQDVDPRAFEHLLR